MSVEAIGRKISRIRSHLEILASLNENCVDRMKTDPLYRGSVLHYLYMMADSCVALAEMVIKHKELPKPQSYADTFDVLGENEVLPPAFAYDFARIAGFRNFLAHDYERINYEDICQVMLTKLEEVEQYLKHLEAAIA